MVDVFISYSKSDRERVAQLARAIEQEGYAVWWDAELPLHQSYGDVITEKIAHSKAAIVVWSPDAAASEWVRAEADTARNHKKLIQTSIGDMIPPMPFNQVQCANLEDWNGEDDHQGWRKVRQSLAALCGPRDKPAASGATTPVVEPASPLSPQPALKTGPITPSPSDPEHAETAQVQPFMGTPDPSSRNVKGKTPSTPVLVGAGVGILALLALGMFLMAPGSDDNASDGDEIALLGNDDTVGGDNVAGGADSANKPGESAEGAAAPTAAPTAAAPAAGEDYNRDVNLINSSGETIFYMYWSPVEATEWGADRLGSEVWPAGQPWPVTVDDGSGACNYDFMGVTANGREIVRQNVNVCAVWDIVFN